MTAVTSTQPTPPDLLLSLLTGMFSPLAADGLLGGAEKFGEFAGLLEPLEGRWGAEEPVSPESELTSGGSGQSELNSLIAASSGLGPGPVPQYSSAFRGGDSNAQDQLSSTLERPGAAWVQKIHSPALSEVGGFGNQVAGLGRNAVSARGSSSQPTGLEALETGSRLSADPNSGPTWRDLSASGWGKAERESTGANPDGNVQLEPSAENDLAANSSGNPASPLSERGQTTVGRRESRQRETEREVRQPWGQSDATPFLPETATGVTAISASTFSRDEGSQPDRGEPVDSFGSEADSRVSRSAIETPAISLGEPSQPGELRASFESALEQLAEGLPLESIAQQIATAAEPDGGWITVEIQPPELGKLEIMVSKQGDDYLARIVAHEAATGDALSLQREQLIDALGQHGLELKEVQITSDTNPDRNWSLDNSAADSGQERGQGQTGREEIWSAPANPPVFRPNPSAARDNTGNSHRQINLLV